VYYFYLDLYIYFGFPLARLKWRILLKSVRLPLQTRGVDFWKVIGPSGLEVIGFRYGPWRWYRGEEGDYI
jgi:hypothetical protein